MRYYKHPRNQILYSIHIISIVIYPEIASTSYTYSLTLSHPLHSFLLYFLHFPVRQDIFYVILHDSPRTLLIGRDFQTIFHTISQNPVHNIHRFELLHQCIDFADICSTFETDFELWNTNN